MYSECMQFNSVKLRLFRMLYIDGKYGGLLDAVSFYFEECGDIPCTSNTSYD